MLENNDKAKHRNKAEHKGLKAFDSTKKTCCRSVESQGQAGKLRGESAVQGAVQGAVQAVQAVRVRLGKKVLCRAVRDEAAADSAVARSGSVQG